jgi:hypothetical protein
MSTMQDFQTISLPILYHFYQSIPSVVKPILPKGKKTLRGELKRQISPSLLFYFSRGIAVYF